MALPQSAKAQKSNLANIEEVKDESEAMSYQQLQLILGQSKGKKMGEKINKSYKLTIDLRWTEGNKILKGLDKRYRG